MESSEDDAGTATNTSRRPSAREKDIGQAEDICATGSFQQDSSEARDSCKTPAMSEDNFDGDSVPSPSTQDVNTSTEAILDMIDEIVDGPGAPKRVPLTVENVESVAKCQSINRFVEQTQTFNCESEESQLSNSEQAVLVKTGEISSKVEDNIESSSNSFLREIADLSEACHAISEKNAESTTSFDKEASRPVVLPSRPHPSIPASCVVQTDQSVSDKNEEACERTVKCVTSSDIQDNVVVGSVECSSSDTSLSDDRVPVSENVTKPLRRRLVRPAPSDRRPDSTVSSTVDLQSINVVIHEQSSNECVVKDVSSSSDAVPPVHGNVKPDEIRNVSEISICKAETSSPTKKIKLIRQKVLPQVSYRDSSLENQSSVRDQCQSTSEILSNESTSELNVISTSKSDTDKEVSDNNKVSLDNVSNEPNVTNVELNESPVKTNNTELQPNECSSNMPASEETIKDLKKIPPIKLNLSVTSAVESAESSTTFPEKNSDSSSSNIVNEDSEATKQVPKLTIKLGTKQSEEIKSPVPKLTIKPIRPPLEEEKEIDIQEQIPCITKINIKPIPRRPEKINDEHRKSSSSEISESEYSENDESTSTSDQASASDQGPADVVPKVTIKLGKVGTEAEGQFYTEKNIPKLTIKGIQQNENDDQDNSCLKLVISQSEDLQSEKVPKLTIKTVAKSESQPLSPKLTIKPIRPPETVTKDSTCELLDIQQIPKLKISTDTFPSTMEGKDHQIPKITIKPILNTDNLKVISSSEVYEQIPVVTKLNIKPIVKPTDSTDMTENMEEKVPVVSKLNIKPVIKPKDNEIDCNREDLPKITKLNIKPLKKPDVKSEEKDCDHKVELDENSIPVVTKINIKPIIKPVDEDISKDEISENQSSETGTSSDDNTDHIPVVTKINIKPIVKPSETEESRPSISNVDNIPVISKLNIKPIIKPEENTSTLSPKKDSLRSLEHRNSVIPIVTKLNIKPVVKPDEVHKLNEDCEEVLVKNPPLVMKINMKTIDTSNSEKSINVDTCGDNVEHINSIGDNVPVLLKSNIKVATKTVVKEDIKSIECLEHASAVDEDIICINDDVKSTEVLTHLLPKQNCIAKGNETASDVHKTHGEKAVTIETKKKVISYDSTLSRENAVLDVTESNLNKLDESSKSDLLSDTVNVNITLEGNDGNSLTPDTIVSKVSNKQHSPSLHNCTLLKKLLETKNDVLSTKMDENKISYCSSPILRSKTPSSEHKEGLLNSTTDITYPEISSKIDTVSNITVASNDVMIETPFKNHLMHGLSKEINENLSKPLEINVSEKITNQSSGQDSPRIILKINKTDHGPSAKIITEEIKRPDQPMYTTENTQNEINDNENIKKNILNIRRKQMGNLNPTIQLGKRLRSSRIVENSDKSLLVKKNIIKRPSTAITSPPHSKEPELSVLETKRLKLGQLLSNKSLSMTPVINKTEQLSPTKKLSIEIKQEGKHVNHTVLKNENCAKNGNSKLHNILSSFQPKIQVKSFNDICHSDKNPSITTEIESSTSTGSCDRVEIITLGKSHPEVQELLFHDNSELHDFNMASEEMSQDPLEVGGLKAPSSVHNENFNIPKSTTPVMVSTPQPKKRGRPRKIPLSEGAKIVLPTPALEERPQRSLRLSRDRPMILTKPRGRGRGRGARRLDSSSNQTPDTAMDAANKFFEEHKSSETIDPTSSRIKLPRMTEALDKMPCSTPLSSRRRNSSVGDLKLFTDGSELKVVLDNTIPNLEDSFLKSPEVNEGRGRGSRGRGSRGRGRGPGRSPRGRGRGRGGGRGAMYMKETMGIYGRVCGPATTTVQLFEEETCMMDDNATPAKPSHLLDEDSQSSVKSSTNESSKTKKSKFADLFDSNKVWTAADVKEYVWPPPETQSTDHHVMMIQEQVAMFLGVKSFKRRYPELKRRTISGEERDYVLSKGLVTEALCDLGITAVDASEVLDIMLSDYPHKYEEYRSHQCRKQLTEPTVETVEQVKVEEVKVEKVDVKQEQKPIEHKPELPKVDPEKTRQDMAAAAIASASEWNARLNSLRRPACADLQSLTLLRRRAPPPPPQPPRVRPPHGFYPLALLPGQYQHCYRVYTSEQLRYFPLNTALAAPPAAVSAESSSDSEADWPERSSSTDSEVDTHPPKRKKLTKTKRSSQQAEGVASGLGGTVSGVGAREEPREEADTCRSCGLRLEANRKYTHERFLVCANCNAKLHPGCVDLGPDTIRKCREYAWQCAECKTCCACRLPADDDKMLFCDLCDRGFHIYCVGLRHVPSGRWHCAECAVCKSCGAREPSGGGGEACGGAPAEWHHQTRRGPGGHKLYSHSLCTPCARAYRIGRYCPLCERSFIGPKGTMQLVICKLCDRQLHQDCVRQTVSKLNVLNYTCGDCRRGGITSRAAAVRLAPRTIATLFMAKRRFNKYAHRQYMQSRLQSSKASENSNDVADDTIESCEPPDRPDEASDASEEAQDPLDVGDNPPDGTE